jgi:hypothetical protein
LSPQFIGPFTILERVGEVAYRLELPVRLADVHDVFHISQLKKGFGPHDKEPLPLDDLNVKEDLLPRKSFKCLKRNKATFYSLSN